MLTRGLHVDVEFNLRSSQTVAFNINVWLNLVCFNAPLDTLCTTGFSFSRCGSHRRIAFTLAARPGDDVLALAARRRRR